MKFSEYIEEKIFSILIVLAFFLFLFLFLLMLEIPLSLTWIFIGFLLLFYAISIWFTYYKQKKSLKKIEQLVDGLEEKYYISEVLKQPHNLINQGYYYALKKACKAMNDKIGQIEKERKEYQEYVESFGHEIKTPIAALALYSENSQDITIKQEIEKINNLIEQMLFYARSENTQDDYFVKELSLEEIIHIVLITYKPYLLQSKITLDIHDLDFKIYTDEKWLHFIISQVLQNAIKYVDKQNKKIEIYGIENKDNISLFIKDNGSGISSNDLSRVFEKGFTGSNRKKQYATGIGLYLCKKLCTKLHLDIQIKSKEKEYTIVEIIFPKGQEWQFK